MARLVNGEWRTDWYREDDGRFWRSATQFHKRVTADGSSGFPAQPGRYHLYATHACPSAQRTLIVRRLRKLDGVIGVSSSVS